MESKRTRLVFAKEVAHYPSMSNSKSGAGSYWIVLTMLVVLWIGTYLGLRFSLEDRALCTCHRECAFRVKTQLVPEIANFVYWPVRILDEQVTGVNVQFIEVDPMAP